MGFFGDLFKEKVNWSEKELKALYMCMSSMAAVDGNADENEIELVGAVIGNLPGSKSFNWLDFATSATEIKVEVHLATLKAMHNKKKKIVLGVLITLALVDGELDDKELQLWNSMKSVLNVDDIDYLSK